MGKRGKAITPVELVILLGLIKRMLAIGEEYLSTFEIEYNVVMQVASLPVRTAAKLQKNISELVNKKKPNGGVLKKLIRKAKAI